MRKTLHDRLYLRFGLFHQRYGRMWAVLLEFLLVAFCCFVVLLFLVSMANFAAEVYRSHERAKHAEQEKASLEKTLLTCLNGGIIGRAGNEFITCEKAMTFQFSRVN